MPYVVAVLILISSVVIETSFLPHFQVLGVVPFISLAFIAALSARYRGLFHFFLALGAGMYFDFVSGGVPGVFTGTFVTVALLGRVIFYRDTGYDAQRSFLWLLGLSTGFIYLINAYVLYQVKFVGWQMYLAKFVYGTTSTVLVGLLLFVILDSFFDWLNKENEERFR